MALVRTKEEQAEALAHVLDDMLRVPGTRMRMGIDPLIGLIPVIGDAIATILAAPILLIALQLNVPWRIVASMGLNQLKNGLIGAIPFIGDAYSFHFKSNAINTALLLRAIKRGEDGACELTAHSITLRDIAGLAALLVPTLVLIGYISFWFWSHNISYLALFFPTPHHSE
jgi:hypothetical protein